MIGNEDWFVLLIGGPSGVGKTTVAATVAKRLGASWLQVDDLRLALARSGLTVPDADTIAEFGAPGGLVTLGEFMTPAIEVVIENHVDQRNPVVIEGDGILPTIFDRPSVRIRSTHGRVRAVFLYEPDEPALYVNVRTRRIGRFTRAHARKNFLYGLWLKKEAELHGLPTEPARPFDSLADRILAASGLTS